ncbi:MAG: transglutaminase domain-containing protein, partial [Candidatus Bathyarchaeota archaeon]
QAILLITLCRIVGIPAFLQIGAIQTHQLLNPSYWDSHLEVVQKWIGWHGWAMVYIPPWKWLPVDLTYVFGGLDNPLNAITNAAVTSQITIQYMNISQTDYVASSRNEREFLTSNNFYVFIEDEMIEAIRRKNWFGESTEWWFPAVLVLAAVLLVASSYAATRRLGRREEPPVPPTNR